MWLIEDRAVDKLGNGDCEVKEMKDEEERLRRPRKKRLRDVDGRYDVSELLSPANTLTNPNNDKKTEL